MRGLKRHILTTALCLAFMAEPARAAPEFYWGADLSFLNEMEDCGARYFDGAKQRDPFELLHERGANLVRIRIWNDAKWTKYSGLTDVRKSIARARKAGSKVLLDFHYSDDWADGGKQIIPKAWEKHATTDALADALYRYTFDTLTALDRDGLMPDLVQVGNETNGEILSTLAKAKDPIDWSRNARLLNAGIKAVRDTGANSKIRPRVMLHIAQPENAEPWLKAAAQTGVTDFDIIGLSYYRKWSITSIAGLGATINRLRHRYAADVLLVETAYPWTQDYADNLPNVLGRDTLMAEYPATPEGQRRYLLDISKAVVANGGVGVVYWEPGWVSTKCKTPWGTGSSWENATLFDFKGSILPGADYLSYRYDYPVEVDFHLPLTGAHLPDTLFLAADAFGEGGLRVPMKREADGYHFRTRLMPGETVRYMLYTSADGGQGLLADGPVDVVIGKQAHSIQLKIDSAAR